MDDILELMFSSFYQLTSLQVGEFSFANLFINLHETFINSQFVDILQIIAVIITLGLLFAAFTLAEKQKEFNQKSASHAPLTSDIAGPGPLQDQWNDILKHVESVREGEWKFAVIEADTITDNVLKRFYSGDTMGERLMNIDKTKLLSIEGLWEAHKVRNRLAHDPNYFLRHAEAVRAIKLYEATLRELEVIS